MSSHCNCSKCRSKSRSKSDKVYIQLSSDVNQDTSKQPRKVRMNLQDAVNGIRHSLSRPSDLKILKSGPYMVILAPQVGTTENFSPSYADFWLRVNDKDISNSNIRIQFSSGSDKDVIVGQAIVELESGDVLNVMMSGSSGTFIEAIKPPTEPLIPSIIFSMFKL